MNSGESFTSLYSSNNGSSTAINDIKNGKMDDLYTDLWKACAGPLVYVPKVGDRVFYFPQGHIEQVEAYANHDVNAEMPVYNLPSKILCKVLCVLLKADVHTDEVFAQVTLLPEVEQEEVDSKFKDTPQMPARGYSRFLVKALTQSDTSTHGGFSLPKRQADECLPRLDMSQRPPVQELVAKDLHGIEWHFRHIYRGKPKRHLLTSGWSMFVTSKRLVVGDACVLVRGRNGDLRIGIRRVMKTQKDTTASVISCHGMQHGILASALHAVCTGTWFIVYYRPWASKSAFIVPYEQYMKSLTIDYSIGTRFMMQFEDKEFREQRFGGTIVGDEDIDSLRWPGSEWRCIMVQWDSTTNRHARPVRVSKWNIEPQEQKQKNQAFLPQPWKRPRPCPNNLLPSPFFVMDGFQWTSVVPQSERCRGVLQGRDQESSDALISSSDAPPLSVPCLPTSTDRNQVQSALENNTCFSAPNVFHQHPQRSNVKNAGWGVCDHWPAACTFRGTCPAQNPLVQNISPANSTAQEQKISEAENDNETTFSQPNRFGRRFMVFGVNLLVDASELPSPQVANSPSPPSVHSSPQSSNSGIVQALIYGTASGRSVDLRPLKGYDDLIHVLDQMFNFNGCSTLGSTGWYLKFTDDRDNLMPVGDYTWQEFTTIAQSIVICPKEEEKGGKHGPCSSDLASF